MASLFNIWGLASGIDTNSIIKALMTSAKAPVTRYENQQLEIKWKQEAWNTIKEKLKTLQSALSVLTDAGGIVTKKGVSSNESVLSVSTTGSAPLGTYIFEVLDIARTHTVTGNSYTSRAEKLTFSQGYITINGKTINVGTQASLLDIAQAINQDTDISQYVSASVLSISSTEYRLVIASKQTGTSNSIRFEAEGNDVLISLGIVGQAQSDIFTSTTDPITFTTGNITINGKTINVGTSASLEDIVSVINNDVDISAKVKASIITTESGYRLAITSLVGSIDTIDFSGDNDALITLGILNGDGTVKYPNSTDATTQLATDLKLSMSGISGTIVRQSNTVTDLFEGVTLNVRSTGTSIVTINYDTSQAISNIERFVSIYNDTITYIRTKLTEEREEGIDFLTEAEKETMTYFEIQQHNEKLKVGLLRNDSTLIEIEEQLKSIVSGVVYKDTNNPLSSNIRSLADIGISTGKVGYVTMEDILSGKLTIDYDALNEALTESPELVAELFSKSYTLIQDETPEGNIDGINTTFKLKYAPLSYDVRPMVYADGTLLTQVFGNTTPGPGQFRIDYTTGTLILGQAPTTSLKVTYGHSVTTENTAGIAVRLNNILKEYTEEVTGVIPYTINSLTAEYKELSELINDTNARLSLYEESLIRKFIALESAIASLQSQSSYLSTYITGLQKQGGK
ncbi:flagellar filament capping protein FliD [bacterium]|nr:flagellar filament capping protein FliD [bacterium]